MAAVLAVLLFASYGYFYEGGGWNQNTRFDLVRAILERRTLSIDAYHENTGDKARVGDHYYMDKAPGASLVALPAAGLVRSLQLATGADVASKPSIVALSYASTVAAAALPAVLATICVFLIALSSTTDRGAALFAALVCGVSTPLWAYATLLYGHALAAGCLMLAFVCALRLRTERSSRGVTWLAAVLGLAAGWAVITEFPASIPAGAIVLFGAWQAWTRAPAARTRLLPAIGLGLAVPAVILLTYNYLAFAAPLHIAYSSEEGFEGMRTGVFGISLPDVSVMRELLFGYQRGLLPLSPVLIAAPIGLVLLIAQRSTRVVGVAASAVSVYFFLLTSGYAYWSGGWSYGSRHLGPALPFLCLGAAVVWQRAGVVVRAVLVGLTIISAGQTLVAVSTTPQPPIQFRDPMRQLLWPGFASGDFPIGWQSVLEMGPPPGTMSQWEREGFPRASWNVGQLAGLRGHASLLPLAALWILGAFRLGRLLAKADVEGAPARSSDAPMLQKR
jgi:4-amino-4-deoxy-L-arabinose transferase-like glycosyltransferase